MKTPILQFGTSRFLQAHADLFLSDAMDAGHAIGPATVVQSSGDASRAHRLNALIAPGGFPVEIRGLVDGTPVESRRMVHSLRRAMSTATDWVALEALFCTDIDFVISNTADKGFAPQAVDTQSSFHQAMSYPAKLQLLLQARFRETGAGITILPTELVAANGATLRARVLELAAPDLKYRAWLNEAVIWADSLVDRIVSEPLEPAGAIAEPYALWAVQNQPGLTLPFQHACLQVVDDLGPVEALKLYILNLGHSYLTHHWLADPQGTNLVRDYLGIDAVRADLVDMYHAEVIPGFAATGLGAQAQTYVETTMDRLQNPFLNHQLADIAGNHDQKIDRRIKAYLGFARSHGASHKTPRLDAVAATI